MTKATHTPGPWQVGCKHSNNGVWTPDGTLVALTHSSSRNHKRDEQIAEQNANARLIAAAPETAAERDRLKALNADLLTALKAACRELVERLTESSELAESRALALACAAIAKAEGR